MLTLNHQTKFVVKVIVKDDTQVIALCLFVSLSNFLWQLIQELPDLTRAIFDLFDALAMAAAVYLAVGEVIIKSVLWGVASWPT